MTGRALGKGAGALIALSGVAMFAAGAVVAIVALYSQSRALGLVVTGAALYVFGMLVRKGAETWR